MPNQWIRSAALGVPLVASEPRIVAASFGGGFFVYDTQIEAARRITAPVQFLLPWDDEYVDRTTAMELFDALISVRSAALRTSIERLPGSVGPPSSGRSCAASVST